MICPPMAAFGNAQPHYSIASHMLLIRMYVQTVFSRTVRSSVSGCTVALNVDAHTYVSVICNSWAGKNTRKYK